MTELSEPVDGAKEAAATLSQLLARILQQLSLSAWLPSAALVLLLGFVFELGSVLDAPHAKGSHHTHDAGHAVGQALGQLGRIGASGLVLMLATVVVLTMLTQAFTFESIRVLEGYWGTGVRSERVAKRRCDAHRRRLLDLTSKERKLTELAWKSAAKKLAAIQRNLHRRQRPLTITPDMMAVMRARVLGERQTATLSDAEWVTVRKLDWEKYADGELLRQRVNIQKRLADYPEAAHVLPTRLGNVLRRHEDKTGRVSVESFVEEVFDELPFSLRLAHDEQRGRLDLYCSMVVVFAAAAIVAVLRLAFRHWVYGAAALTVGIVGSGLSYRAAIASARAYGAQLITIAKYVDARSGRVRAVHVVS